jgi:transcriptional regulator with XRE-family HTH domain
MTSQPSRPSLTIHRRRLGRELRQLRESRALRLEDAAAQLGLAPSTLSRIETGKAPIRTSYLTLLLDFYGLNDPDQRKFLTDLARESQRKAWWIEYADLLPTGAGIYLDLEAAASRVAVYSTQAVPDLAQTEDYAAAASRASRPDLTLDQLARLAAIQARRLRAGHDQDRQLHLIIEEAALHARLGAKSDLASQVSHLFSLSTVSSVTVQVIPLTTTRAILCPSFTILDFTGPAEPSVASYGMVARRIDLVTRPGDVAAAKADFAQLTRAALPPPDSADLIAALANDRTPRTGCR